MGSAQNNGIDPALREASGALEYNYSEFFLDTEFRKSTGCFIFCCTLCSLFGFYWIAFPERFEQLPFSGLGTAVLGPVILPIYLASRPLKEGEVREGEKLGTYLRISRFFGQ